MNHAVKPIVHMAFGDQTTTECGRPIPLKWSLGARFSEYPDDVTCRTCLRAYASSSRKAGAL